MAAVSANRLALVARNSMANGVRAVSGSILTVILPLVLVAILSKESFAIWAVAFSIASYVLYFDLGIPTSLQALVAQFERNGANSSASKAVRSGLRIIFLVAGVSMLLGLAVSLLYGVIFPSTPPSLVEIGGTTLIIALLGQVSSLVSNVASGYYAGLQRNIEPTKIVVSARIASLLLSASAALAKASLIVIALGFSLPLIIGCTVMLIKLFREIRRHESMEVGERSQSSALAILRYSGPLMVWNVCLLLVSGVGLAIIGRLDYGLISAFAVANVFAVGIASLDGAVIASLVPEFGRAHVDGDKTRLSQHVLRSSRLNSIFVLVVGAGVLSVAPVIVFLLLEPSGRSTGLWMIVVVVATTVVRALAAPLSLAFVATAAHKRVLWPPILEAAITLFLSLLWGSAIGAQGVVLGGLVGAILGSGMTLTISKRLSKVIDASVKTLIWNSAILPIMPFAAFIAVLCASSALHWWSTVPGVIGVFCAFLIGLPLSWLALGGRERRMLLGIIRRDGRSAPLDA